MATIAVRRRRITAAFRADALNVLELSPITVDADTDAYAWTTTLQLADRFVSHSTTLLILNSRNGGRCHWLRSTKLFIPAP
jgi:hypothetical protein